MSSKRIRIFAGPNGSGKTTIINQLRNKIRFGVYVNADDIEKYLKKTNLLSFQDFQLDISQTDLENFFKASNFAPFKRNEPDLWEKLKVKKNVLSITTKIDSYLAADIAEFIRQQLLENDISFTYETVMSHESKIDFLQKARDRNFKVYLYYIATEDPEINVSRVNVRVSQDGHSVAPETIKNRYYKSLKLLKKAVKITNRAYIWDNSNKGSLLISEITEGNKVEIFVSEKIPNWFIKYLVE
jgi:predicted ABC-type ATPase